MLNEPNSESFDLFGMPSVRESDQISVSNNLSDSEQRQHSIGESLPILPVDAQPEPESITGSVPDLPVVKITCHYCDTSSPVFTALPCCQERLKAYLDAMLIERTASQICDLEGTSTRRQAIDSFGIKHGNTKQLLVETEVKKRWKRGPIS